MSGAAIGWAKRQQAPSPISKAILAALADYAGPGQEERDAPAEADGRHFAFVGVERMARETQYNVKTISRHLARLVDAGLIVRVRRMNGFIRTSSYTILACDGAGDRPFTDEERLIAAALSGDRDSQSSSGVTCEEDSQGFAGKPPTAPVRYTPVGPTEEDSQGVSEQVPGVPCVPYTGTTSNYEPPVDPPVAHERDLFSPGFLTEPSGDVSSGQTLAKIGEIAKRQREGQRATEVEIMTKFEDWFLRETQAPLPAGQAKEIRKVVSALLSDKIDRKDVAWGLAEWAMSRSAYSPKSIESFVLQGIRRRLPVPDDRKPNKAQERHEQNREVVRSVARSVAGMGRKFTKEDAEMLLQRASGLGVAVTEQRAIGGTL